MLYKRLLPLLATILLAVGMVSGLYRGVTAVSTTNAAPTIQDSNNSLTELLPGYDYIDWYSNTIRAEANRPGHYFGAYKFEPIADQLYIGFGSGRPADEAGSLLAVTNGSLITDLHDLDEEGFIDMAAVDGDLFIPGPDPHYGDNWAWGNFYVQSPGQPITKYRNLPNVIHTWGSWYDAENGILYAAVSSHLGDNATWTGEIFSSTDQAQTWTRVATATHGVGDYRTYDVIGFNGDLYATWNDVYVDPCGLAHSDDGGLTWTRLTTITSQPLTCRSRLHVWQGNLVALGYDQESLVAVATDNTVTTHTLPNYRVPSWSYNPLTNDGNGYMYIVAEHGQIIRTNNLEDWELLSYTDLDFFTIAYWPYHNWLVVGERGNGRIWQLDLDSAHPIPQIPDIAAGESYLIGNLILMVDPDGLGDISYLEVATYTQDHPHALHEGLQTGQYWYIGAKNEFGQPATGFTATLTITVDFIPSGQDKLCRYTGSEWDCGLFADHTYDAGNRTITRHDITEFSTWTVGKNVGPTAVSLANIGVNTAVSPSIILILLLIVAGTAVGLLTSRRRSTT